MVDGCCARYRWLDVRANQAIARGGEGSLAEGGGLWMPGFQVPIQNAIIAGNLTGSDGDARGAGLAIADDGHFLAYADIVGNQAVAVGDASGGGVYLQVEEADAFSARLVGVSVSGNRAVGATGSGGGLHLPDGTPVELFYSNLHGNEALEQPSNATGLPDWLDAAGNQTEPPDHVDTSGTNPLTWDLTLGASSKNIDAGPVGELDADGSRADIGAFGGPDGGGW